MAAETADQLPLIYVMMWGKKWQKVEEMQKEFV